MPAYLILAVSIGLAPPDSGALDATMPPMVALVDRYADDWGSLDRTYGVPLSDRGRERRIRFIDDWTSRLDEVEYDTLDVDGRIDWLLLRNELRHERSLVEHERSRRREMEPIVAWANPLIEMLESHRRLEPVEPRVAAQRLTEVDEQITSLEQQITEDLRDSIVTGPAVVKRTVANRAATAVDDLRRALGDWYRFYEGYDPIFTWWVAAPHARIDGSLERFATMLREKLAGVTGDDDDAIIGDPIGEQALLDRLAHEMIPYTPAELIDIAGREYAWCEQQMRRASVELGFGDDWRAALDHVKGLHVEPGEQPQLIRELAYEAVDFIEERELLTIPPLCVETWRMRMMSPAQQRVSPYFLGGEVIQVAFPTDAMEHPDKLMSLRGNNRHFARATVHHELIPGHHLQGFMTQRHRTHRRVFRTPFWIEGWALYWEMRLWDLDFPRSAEDRVGMLFWRMHRCARIVFSLSFHLERMTAQECIEYLVKNVGHERNNATAEVRRSVSGDYGPLYQAAYMLGGLQLRALRGELVETGRMSERDFHDAVLRQNAIPIEMVRAALAETRLERDHDASWRFADG